MHQPHDKLFKAGFSDPETTARFLRSQLPPALTAAIDWSSLRLEPGCFIDSQFRQSESDLLFHARAGKQARVHFEISFLGAGASPPTAEWGLMVAGGRHYLPGAWWPSLFPGLAIFVTVMSLNLIGDGLRDLFAGD